MTVLRERHVAASLGLLCRLFLASAHLIIDIFIVNQDWEIRYYYYYYYYAVCTITLKLHFR